MCGLFGFLTGVAQNEQAPLVVVHINVAARVHRELFTPVDFGSVRAGLARQTRPLRRYEIANFLRQARIAYVENTKACIEPRDINQIARLLDRRVMNFLTGIMRPEPASM